MKNNLFYVPQLAVEVLKLAQLSVEHFLAPNLALLVDTLSGSYMQNMGPIIVKRLHDSSWEVRDSVLELLASMANISLLSTVSAKDFDSF